MPRHNILIIANRRSGTGYAGDLEALAARVLGQTDSTYTLEYTRAPGHATDLARDGIRDGFTVIVAAGGDGTVNEVARALVGTTTPMGIIPRGSGNGLARHLGIPLVTENALTLILESTPVPIDTFTLNEKLSLNISGIGFDGHVAELFGRSKGRGLLNYTRIALGEYHRFPPFSIRIDQNISSELHGVFFVAIANSSQYGNNAYIAPGNSVRDGKLMINAVSRVPMYRLDAIWSLFSGNLANTSWCTTFETTGLTIHTDRKVAYHVDGEPCEMEDTFVVSVKPKSLRVIVPNEKVI